ncbi:MAG TPA: hypothetical protein VGL99_31115 [Chloroflexota bacterium]|jgi:hypothetical protein
MMSSTDGGLPIEQFIQALASQLDRVQTAMAMKARSMPLTYAVKDLSLDLRAHIAVSGSAVLIRPAGPGDRDASTLRMTFTTITRPMIEENTMQLSAAGEPSLHEVLGDDLSEEDQRRLEWVGVHNLAQLRDLHSQIGDEAIERSAQLPVSRLRQALERAARPQVLEVLGADPDTQAADTSDATAPLLRIRGRNLMQQGQPAVRIDGEAVTVLEASVHELLVAPLAHQLSGTLSIETAPGTLVEAPFDVTDGSAA